LGVSGFLAAAVFAAGLGFTPVPSANPKAVGMAAPNILPPELVEAPLAQGSFAVENPAPAVNPIPAGCPNAGGAALSAGFYGYASNGPLLPALNSNVEASKTEPDENTYLIMRHQHGPDAQYDYGTHFLYQGHEVARGYITRINLDADGPHRVTVLASSDSNGCPIPTIDGSGWDPFAHRLLFTSEGTGNQSVVQATPDYPSTVDDLTSEMGHGGYEGVIPDDWGRIYLVEDIGGTSGSAGAHLNKAKQPNSFVYRFVPYLKGDLKQGGILQVLQVRSLANPGQPIVFHGGAADSDILSQDVKDLHTYGKTFDTQWIAIHDTATCPTPTTCPSWNANTLAKTLNGTPFKRPENGRFRPGSRFNEFVFDETGDTDNTAVGSGGAGAAYGQFGAIFKLKQLPGNTGKLTLVYNSPDAVHAGFDNCSFWDDDHVVFVEDAGDTLHGQRNALDSAWMFDLTADYSNPANQPRRLLAEGRDPSATIDSGLLGTDGFQNEGDNEITGFVVSNGDGDGDRDDVLGDKIPRPFQDGWRVFWTQQHGDNTTLEILRVNRDNDGDHDDHGDRSEHGEHGDR
jgi:hypothetical protein